MAKMCRWVSVIAVMLAGASMAPAGGHAADPFVLRDRRSHRHHRQHAGRADAIRRLARDDDARALSEARAGRCAISGSAATRSRPDCGRRISARPTSGSVEGALRSAVTRRIASTAPTPRRTSSSRSSATTSPTPARKGSKRSSSSSATGSRTRWRRSTTSKSAPRLVVFSPDCARKSRQSRSAGRPGEQQTAGRLCQGDGRGGTGARGVRFVDLFTPSRALYSAAKSRLDDQGRAPEQRRATARLARSSTANCSGPRRRTRSRTSNALRQAVVDKDFHWFNRYRTTDGFATYGDRAFLTFIRGNPAEREPGADHVCEGRRAPDQLRSAAARIVGAGRDDR